MSWKIKVGNRVYGWRGLKRPWMKARNLKGLASILLLLAVLFSFVLIVAQASRVQAWGWYTHRFIVGGAKDVFSDGSFFSAYYSTIYTYCTKPDDWAHDGYPYERYRHWYHVDVPHDESQYWDGVLPWAVEDNFDMLVQSLEDEDWGHAALLMGVISHYTADATMPLHATSDYWLDGMHSTYETKVNGRLGEISIPDYVPQELENIFDAAMATLEESYGFTGNTEDDLSYWLRQYISWNPAIRDITENRLRAGVQFTANLWYTAMIRAGLATQAPTLLEPENGTCATSDNLTFTWTSIDGTNFYDFQLASDNGFTSEVTTVKGLSATSYTLENSLTEGSWYWRVRSGDNSTHVGLWSQNQWFTVTTENYQTNVLISPSENSAENGQSVTFTVMVKNIGVLADNYTLENIDNQGWPLVLDDYSFENVPPGENCETKLTVWIPENAIGCTRDNIMIIATSQGDPSVSDNENCIVHVLVVRGVHVSISPQQENGENGQTVTFTVAVTNTGNVLDTYALENEDNQDWTLKLENEVLEVPASENRETTLSVAIPSDAENCTHDNITVTATSQTDNTVENHANCIAHAVVALPVRSVQVSIEPENQKAPPENTLTFTVRVTNTGEVTDNYDLIDNDDAGWGTELAKNLLENVGPGENRETTVSVTVPENAVENTWAVIRVTATSRADPSVTDNDTCRAIAGAGEAPPERGVQVSISENSKSAEPGEELCFSVTVINTGADTDTFTITAEDNENWAPTVSPAAPFSLGAGENRLVELSITIPDDAADGDSTTITVTASGTGYNDSTTSTANVTKEGGLPITLIAIVVVVVVVVVAGALMFLRGRRAAPSWGDWSRALV